MKIEEDEEKKYVCYYALHSNDVSEFYEPNIPSSTTCIARISSHIVKKNLKKRNDVCVSVLSRKRMEDLNARYRVYYYNTLR